MTGGPLARGDIPIFVFHSLEPVSFERQAALPRGERLPVALRGRALLRAHGRDQGPRPRGRPDLRRRPRQPLRRGPAPHEALRHAGDRLPRPRPRSDGRRPAPDLGRRGGGPRPRRERGRARARSAAPVVGGDRGHGRSGLFDFQSHTLTHPASTRGRRWSGFVTPDSRRGYDAFDIPLAEQDGRDLLGEELPLGTPLLRSEPRTSEALRFYEAPEIRPACQAAVRQGGDGEVLRATRLGDPAPPSRSRAAGSPDGRRRRSSGRRHPVRAPGVQARPRGAPGPAGAAPLLPVAHSGADHPATGSRGGLPLRLRGEGARRSHRPPRRRTRS